MNNLHRELAPVSAAAWAEIDSEAERTFKRHVAGRRAVDVRGPAGPSLAAVGTGHLDDIEPPGPGVRARIRRSLPLVELRAPFRVDRRAVDDVERDARDPDLSAVKEAARAIAFAEDRVIFEGYPAAGVAGLRPASSGRALSLPQDAREYPRAAAEALSALRLAGVAGPYTLVLGADAYTAVTETSDYGYPVHDQISRALDGEIIWAPAVAGAFLVSTRGGDFALHLGRDLSIGYASHDAASVELYFEESLTFAVHSPEAVIALR